jgi:hypothetical protein
MKLRCKLGFHKWSKSKIHYIWDSNVEDHEQYCKLCNKKRRFAKTF